MVKRIALHLLCGLLVSGALAPSAWAATPERPAFDELIRRAGFIFEGEVIEVDSRAGGTDEPRTRVTMRVIEQLDGDRWRKGDTFVFDLPMGELPDGRFVDLPGAPLFVPGEVYLAFYTAETWYNTPIVAWDRGLLRLTRHSQFGELWTLSGGRCASGLGRLGIEIGPFVEPWPTPDGWPERTHDKVAEAGVERCVPAQDLVRRLRRRIFELGARGRGYVQTEPAGATAIPLDSAREGD